eukprot:4948104-Prymnesium_polylepis.2
MSSCVVGITARGAVGDVQVAAVHHEAASKLQVGHEQRWRSVLKLQQWRGGIEALNDCALLANKADLTCNCAAVKRGDGCVEDVFSCSEPNLYGQACRVFLGHGQNVRERGTQC